MKNKDGATVDVAEAKRFLGSYFDTIKQRVKGKAFVALGLTLMVQDEDSIEFHPAILVAPEDIKHIRTFAHMMIEAWDQWKRDNGFPLSGVVRVYDKH